jgi:hypothetical protein
MDPMGAAHWMATVVVAVGGAVASAIAAAVSELVRHFR